MPFSEVSLPCIFTSYSSFNAQVKYHIFLHVFSFLSLFAHQYFSGTTSHFLFVFLGSLGFAQLSFHSRITSLKVFEGLIYVPPKHSCWACPSLPIASNHFGNMSTKMAFMSLLSQIPQKQTRRRGFVYKQFIKKWERG